MKSHPQSSVQLAKPSESFDAKLAATKALLTTAAEAWQPLKQASSLGAEDVVITHLIEKLQLPIPVFVLETGALHSETLALLERLQASAKTKVEVYKPKHEAKHAVAFANMNLWVVRLKAREPGSRGCAANNPKPAPMFPCRKTMCHKVNPW